MQHLNTLFNSRGKARRGAAMVEFAIVSLLLILLVFGICEFGLMFKDVATLNQAAREAARSAALGSLPSVATARAETTAANITFGSWTATTSGATSGTSGKAEYATIALTYATPTSSGTVTSWSPLIVSPTDSALNSANSGDMVRATITYNHPTVTGLFFTGGYHTLTTNVIMRRE